MARKKCVNLDTKITITSRTVAKGSFGALTSTETVHDEWASIRSMGGAEQLRNGRITPGEMYAVTIRFKSTTDGLGNPFYTVDDVVTMRGKKLGVTSVRDLYDDRRYLRLDCEANKDT